MDNIISQVDQKRNLPIGRGQQIVLKPSSRVPAGLPAASVLLRDELAREEYNRLIFELLGKNPSRSKFRELAKKASALDGRKKGWTGSHLYNLMDPVQFYKYGLNPDLLGKLRIIAREGIGAFTFSTEVGREVNNSITVQSQKINTNVVNNEGNLENLENQNYYTKLDKRRKKEGRGQGCGGDYSPWIHVQDFASKGLSTRTNGYKINRTHHFLSILEYDYFLITEWNPAVVDLREQYPLLPIEETIEIAKELNIKHPVEPKTQLPIIMTTDLLITSRSGLDTKESARSVKYSKDLEKSRVIDKLEIERQYWTRRHVEWAIVTEREISKPIVKNIKILREYREINDRINIDQREIEKMERVLRKILADMPFNNACQYCDNAYELPQGTAMVLVYHFIATNQWLVNLQRSIAPDEFIIIQSS
jgi:hypothetical protein